MVFLDDNRPSYGIPLWRKFVAVKNDWTAWQRNSCYQWHQNFFKNWMQMYSRLRTVSSNANSHLNSRRFPKLPNLIRPKLDVCARACDCLDAPIFWNLVMPADRNMKKDETTLNLHCFLTAGRITEKWRAQTAWSVSSILASHNGKSGEKTKSLEIHVSVQYTKKKGEPKYCYLAKDYKKRQKQKAKVTAHLGFIQQI